jgi:phage shock protein C
MVEHNKLYRSRADRVFGGVCGGLGQYFDVEPLIFRAVFLVLLFGGGAGLLIYILMLIIVPNEPVGFIPENHFENGKENLSSEGGSASGGHNFAQDIAGHAQAFAAEVRTEVGGRNYHPRRGGRVLFGLIIVILGAALLLDQFFPVGWFRWNYFWPALLIILGVAILSRRRE